MDNLDMSSLAYEDSTHHGDVISKVERAQPEPANRGASISAIQFHYDVGNTFYKLWLDESLVYSAARWTDPLSGVSLADTLTTAQRSKIDFHLSAVRAKKGDSILDIGCGWGAILLNAVSRYQVDRATGLTLSDEQLQFIEAQNNAKIDVQLRSYEHFTAAQPYDGVISIGAFEHFVKPEMSSAERIQTYRQFFACVANNLKPGGRLSLQTICWSDIDDELARKIVPIDVFPESTLPYIPEIFAAGCDAFTPLYMENNASDYVRTLEVWLQHIREQRETVVEHYGADLHKFYERYLRTSIIGFKTNRTSLARLVFQKK